MFNCSPLISLWIFTFSIIEVFFNLHLLIRIVGTNFQILHPYLTCFTMAQAQVQVHFVFRYSAVSNSVLAVANEIMSTSFSGDLLELLAFYMEPDRAKLPDFSPVKAVNLQFKFPLSFILLYLQLRKKKR